MDFAFCHRNVTLRIQALMLTLVLITPACNLGKPRAGATRISQTDGMMQVYVPAGEFEMGSAMDDPRADEDEKPLHRVYLDSFWMDRTEVTNEMYAQCTVSGVCSPPAHSFRFLQPEYASHPAIGISWFQAQTYCEWAGRRLPTEAEWEKAAHGADRRIYPWGNTPPTSELLNFDQIVDDTTPAGSYPNGVSPYGALDMAGNAWEWVADWYDPEYYARSPAANPTGGSAGILKVLRGGDRNSNPDNIRVTERFWAFPGRNDLDGFRCAESP